VKRIYALLGGGLHVINEYGQRGAVNVGNVMLLGIAMIMAGVGAYFIPILISGFDAARTASNISEFTLALTIIQLGPGIIILGYVVAVGVVGFLGIKGISGH